jgi:hypothetical protein
LSLHVPVSAFQELPPQLISDLETFIADNLSLEHTRPPFIEETIASNISIILAVDSFAFIASGSPELNETYSQIKSWITAEESFFRPQEKQIRLPDGTRAAESIPGETNSHLFSSSPNPACERASWPPSSQSSPIYLWLCRNEQAILLIKSSDQPKILGPMYQDITKDWSLTIDSNLSMGIHRHIQGIKASSTEGNIMISLMFDEQAIIR